MDRGIKVFVVLVILVLGIFFAWKFGYITQLRDWWDDFTHVDEDDDEGDDGGNNTTPDDDCPVIVNLGQRCDPDEPCCEEGTACAKRLLYWECVYVRPECENVPPFNYTIGEYSYEEYVEMLDFYEQYEGFYEGLNGENELGIDFAYEPEQCMDNHESYVDYCCRCPSGTVARFVWLPEQQVQYMWCFPNPQEG